MSKIRAGAPDTTSDRNWLLLYNFVMQPIPVFQRIYMERDSVRKTQVDEII